MIHFIGTLIIIFSIFIAANVVYDIISGIFNKVRGLF